MFYALSDLFFIALCGAKLCMMCAKLIHHAGIGKVVIVDGGFGGENGIGYLENHGVNIQRTEGPKDPRF